VPANTPRTVYACGSSDYDKRPGTFTLGKNCTPHTPFTTDGCSDCGLSKLFAVFGKDVPVELNRFCVEHDRAYWLGGTPEQRIAADRLFAERIASLGDTAEEQLKTEKRRLHRAMLHLQIARFKTIAAIYYRSVRMGGVPWLPTSFRWGYGKLKA
jgi:hypothetical protein